MTLLREPSSAIDIVLADLTLIAADDRRIAAAIAERRSRPGVIYMSVEAEASRRRQQVPAACGFLAKPFTAEELTAAIRSAADAMGPEQ